MVACLLIGTPRSRIHSWSCQINLLMSSHTVALLMGGHLCAIKGRRPAEGRSGHDEVEEYARLQMLYRMHRDYACCHVQLI